MRHKIISLLSAVACYASISQGAQAETKLLNVSYDPTRELYEEINQKFAADWKEKKGETLTISQSHGGSAKQARSVMEGLPADVVTLALAYDIDVIAEKTGLISKEWQARLPNHSTPFQSTIVFLVRKGNPKHIHDWDDLVKPGVSVMTPNPKTSGGARWNYMAAWAYAMKKYHQDETKAKNYMQALFGNVPLLDTGARAATITFVRRQIGDVLLSWENEAYLAKEQMGKEQFDIIMPSLSIQAEPPVAVVDEVVKKKNTQEAATAYLQFLYTKSAQEIAAKHFFRPTDAGILANHRATFPSVQLVTIDQLGGWKKVQETHFADGGIFDQIYTHGQR